MRATAPTSESMAARYRRGGLWVAEPLRVGLERVAELDGDRLAIVDDLGGWSYGQLRDEVETRVGALVERNVGSDDAVVIVAPNTRESVAYLLAAWRAGAIAVVVDRRCGWRDLARAVTQSEARHVVADERLWATLRVRDHGVTAIRLTDRGAPVGDWDEPDAATPRVVTFTSGTTRGAKGVVHSLCTIRAGANNLRAALAFDDRDRPFLASPLASITGITQIVMCSTGASILMCDQFDASRSVEAIERHGATVVGGAPVILEMIFEEYAKRDAAVSPLQRIALGGTMIPRRVLEIAVERFGMVPTRVYGSSEAPVHTSSAREDTLVQRLTDDGVPHRGCEVRLGASCDGGSELELRGPNLFQGYLDVADNDGAFDEGWFRSGDVVSISEGRVRVGGRRSDVVVRKGLKVSLAEVDLAAQELGVAEAASYGVPDPETGERVALALRALPGTAVGMDEVIAKLSAWGLARRSMPEEIVIWDEPLPRNASGKIVRAALLAQGATKQRVVVRRLTPTIHITSPHQEEGTR